MAGEGMARLGPYAIAERIGRGGMATVYRARQPALGRDVALKVLPAFLSEDPAFRERFHREALAIARLRHPNVVTVHDAGEHDGVLYIATELVEGGTLADILGRPMPVERAVEILRPIAAALDHAHGEGVVHRDVKPSNILMRADGSPVLSDFGLARIAENVAGRTATGVALGTPEYMAPEHGGSAPVGPAADLYSLAVIVYQMLTGRLPFTGETPVEVVNAQLRGGFPLPRSVERSISYAVQDVLVRGLARDLRRRHPSATAFVDALHAASLRRPTIATPIVARARAGLASPARRALAGGAVAVLAVAAAAAIVWQWQTAEPTAALVPAPAIPGKGALLYNAPLDPSGSYLASREVLPTADAAEVRARAGLLELGVREGGARAMAKLAYRHEPTYVADVDLRIIGSSQRTQLVWELYETPAHWHSLAIQLGTITRDAEAREVRGDVIMLASNDEQRPEPGNRLLARPVIFDAVREGRKFTLTIAVTGSRYRVYVDGERIIDVAEARTEAGQFSFVLTAPAPATARITGVRVYAYSAAE